MATRDENLKKINDELEKMSDEELDQVAGGTKMETWRDSDALVKRGFLTHEQSLNSGAVRQKLHELGYTGYIDYGNSNKDCNIYTDKAGNKISRENFWKLFDRENPRDPSKYPLSW